MKKHYKVNERVVCLHNGKHGWVSEIHEGIEPDYHIYYDRPVPNGPMGAFLKPSLIRPETFLEFLFMRKGYFGKWSTWQAVLIYGFYGILTYIGVRTITYFDQPIIGAGLIVFAVAVAAGSIRLHWENFKGRSA